MKKRLLILLFCFGFVAIGFAQETTEPTVFDYAKTKHELSLNIAPVLVGEYPFDLLYRKHYVSKNGKNVAFRLGAGLYANLGSVQMEDAAGIDEGSNNGQSFQAYLGREWQRNFHSRIIGYYGADFSFGYGRSFNEFIPNDPNQNSVSTKTSGINFGAIGFLGMKYHLSKHFSISAETSAFLSYYQTTRTDLSSNSTLSGDETIKSNDFRLSQTPLRAIRFAFHF
jgi:hypothetical protein